MHLVQKQNGKTKTQLDFASGPVYIGRGSDCQVLLRNREASRQHAVIYTTDGAGWWIKDLCSANGTKLNGRAIERAKLKNGDRIGVGDSLLEVDLKDEAESAHALQLEDTLVGMPSGPRVTARPLEFDHAPPLRMPPHRAADFIQAASLLGKASGPDETAQAVLKVLSKQFVAARCWCGLRYNPTGALTTDTGKTDLGETFSLQHSVLKDRVRRTLEERVFLLVTALKDTSVKEPVRSAMVGPLVGSHGNYGVLYLDSHPNHESYQASDLDYLVFLALHLGAILENY